MSGKLLEQLLCGYGDVKIAELLVHCGNTWFDATLDVCEDIARVHFLSISRHMQLDSPARNIRMISLMLIGPLNNFKPVFFHTLNIFKMLNTLCIR